MSGPLEFVIYVLKGDLFMELPSYDYGTFDDTRLQMQKGLSTQIRQRIYNLQMMSGYESVEINQRMTWGFKIAIHVGKVTAALKIIEEFLAIKNIRLRVIYLNLTSPEVVPAPNNGESKGYQMYVHKECTYTESI